MSYRCSVRGSRAATIRATTHSGELLASILGLRSRLSIPVHVTQNKMEESNPILKAAILEVVENQINDNDPPETRATLARLVGEGISEDDARVYIAQAVCVEIWDTMTNGKTYDIERYVRNLRALPEEPEP